MRGFYVNNESIDNNIVNDDTKLTCSENFSIDTLTSNEIKYVYNFVE